MYPTPPPSAPMCPSAEMDHCSILKMVASFGDRRYEMVYDAAETENIPTLAMFFRVGVSRDRKVGGMAPIHIATLRNRVEAVKFLILSGANVNALSGTFETPLHIAAREGHTALVKIFLDAKVKMNGLNNQLRTPLHLALEKKFSEIVHLLCQYGADIEKPYGKKSFGKPLHLAAASGKLESVMPLLERRAEVDALDYKKRTPLIMGIDSGNPDVVNALLTSCANPNAATSDELTPLHFAASQSEDIVALLLSSKANLHTVSKEQSSPLHFAARKGNLAVVRILLTHNADLTIPDSKGKSAYQYAVDGGHSSIISLLEPHVSKATPKSGTSWFSRKGDRNGNY